MDELSFSLYLPLLVLGLICLVLFIAAQLMTSRGGGLSGRLLDLAFGIALLAGVYVVVLLLISLVSEPDVIYDIVAIMVIVGVFFAALLFLLFGLFELIFSRGGRKAAAPKSD